MSKKLKNKSLFVAVNLILILVILYSGLRILESTIFFKEQGEEEIISRVIVRDGISFYPRKDITILLIMGINQSGKVEKTEYNHGGAADMVTLVVFDENSQKYDFLSLNRDMMVNMPMLTNSGREAGTYYGQLAYSHTYGDGMKDSCENVRKTVSNLLYGIEVDYYLSMNIDTISTVNDAVGGVTVNIIDDFSAVDPDLPMGEVTLLGKQAVTFVQTRWNVGDELNLSRMERQKEYMDNFVPVFLDKMRENTAFVTELYEQVSDYIVTDCSIQVLDRLQKDYGGFSMGEILSVPGENVLGETYYEFYPDEEALDNLIIDMFYSEIP